MDDIVKQALAKWPNVPHCTGWLLLDRRGNWRMRDEAAQAAGAPGEPIRHTALLGFINRNYEADETGQWFFQNGPQRVYVELGYTPFVVRLARDDLSETLMLTDQGGAAFEPAAAYLDDEGGILFIDRSTPARTAVLHDHDLDLFSEHADLASDGQSGDFRWRDGEVLKLEPLRKAEVEKRFGFVASPAAHVAAGSVPSP
ncbi:Protein of unknown function (DUF2946) [Paraburkholderia caribensis MBA4]|uniref:DUF2946 family protein n=1 Tax=Paraburkholderia caribensis MBA4 TaxID=1323664 RepID=A0A0P0R492_9BURK|nr:DUF2946 family protein [Paraburkholderia caribensis]ALL62990.1 Protein of unknown function (DUF2946) [Paraburkholderia caribensis MBA4]